KWSDFPKELKSFDAVGTKDSLNLKKYLETVNEIYTIRIDSNLFKSDFIISTNAKDRMGFETYLNIKNLDEGKHILTITGPTKENKLDSESKTIEKVLVNIPFWYFPENISSSNTQNNRIAADTILTN
ncbi:MAG TPA: hypothetical protein DCG42_09535, partial [Maribacter sp.]|nr:hypothetical protein [Maribacter sp.]